MDWSNSYNPTIGRDSEEQVYHECFINGDSYEESEMFLDSAFTPERWINKKFLSLYLSRVESELDLNKEQVKEYKQLLNSIAI